MINFQEITKYKLLKQFIQKVSMYRICKILYGKNLHAVWLECDIDGKRFFEWSFLERRQLFLELIAYHLEKKNIKFGLEVDLKGQKLIRWDESATIEDTIAYLEKGFSKNEETFEHGTGKVEEMFKDANIDPNNWIKGVIKHPIENFDMDMYCYVFNYCPWIVYWNEESHEWIQS